MTGPKLNGNRCQCPACGLLFSSPREFDRHRIGSYALPGQPAHKRRCLTHEEMDARGWQISERGFRMQARRERAPAAIEAPRVPLPATHVAEGHNEAP